MRVLVAHPSTELYGSDRQLLESVGALTAAGANVTVALPGDGPLARRVRTEYGVLVVAPRFAVLRKAELRPLRLLLLMLRTPLIVAGLARHICDIDPDVVYVNTVTLPHWVLAARLARRRVVVHVHEAEELSSPAVRRALYAPLLAAHRVVANSATTQRVLTRSWRRLRSRLVVVPNGVPDAGFAAPISAGPDEAHQLVLVSRLSPRKGVDVALEAVARLRTAGRNVHLTVAGTTFAGYEWFESQLRARAERPDLAGAVTFAGFVDPAAAALAAAEIVLVPSLGESFGNAAVEGMLARRPVVASDVQGLAEILRDGETGLLVPPGDSDAIADAVARLLDDADLCERLGAAARRDAVERFSITGYRDAVNCAVAGATGKAGHLTAAMAACALAAVTLAGCTSDPGAQAGATSATPSTSVTSSGSAPSSGASASSGAASSGAAPSGALASTVPSRTVVTRPAVPLTATAAFGDGVRLQITGYRRVAGKASGPGEVAGPALRLDFRLTNDTKSTLDLTGAAVTATDARRNALSPLTFENRPFTGSLAVGKSATARYEFTLAFGRHNPYRIVVSYSGRSAVVQFAGDAV